MIRQHMIVQVVRAVLVLVACCSMSGCATTSTVKHAQGTGVTRTYAYPIGEMTAHVRRAVGLVGLQIVEVAISEDGRQASVIAEKSLSAFSYGERVAVFLTQAGPRQTRVEVVSKKVMATNLFAKNWTQDIFETLDTVSGEAP